jgi:hypothetical protein
LVLTKKFELELLRSYFRSDVFANYIINGVEEK